MFNIDFKVPFYEGASNNTQMLRRAPYTLVQGLYKPKLGINDFEIRVGRQGNSGEVENILDLMLTSTKNLKGRTISTLIGEGLFGLLFSFYGTKSLSTIFSVIFYNVLSHLFIMQMSIIFQIMSIWKKTMPVPKKYCFRYFLCNLAASKPSVASPVIWVVVAF